MQWPHCGQVGEAVSKVTSCLIDSPLCVCRVRAPALEPRGMLTNPVKSCDTALCRPFARLERRSSARVEFALYVVLVAVLARVVRGEFELTRRAPTFLATDSTRAAADELEARGCED